MGRPIISQKRGKGGPSYRVPPYSFQPQVEYKNMPGRIENMPGRIVDLVNDKRRNSPLAKVKYDDRKEGYLVAAEGMRVGDKIENFVTTLSKVELGVPVSSVELWPHSGPKLCRTSGCTAVVISKSNGRCVVQLPSRKTKVLDENCRATIGLPAADGRLDKYWVKAGKKWHAKKARGKMYPRTSANKMNVVDHPFGGHARLGRPKTCARNTPPGRKCGSIAARRCGMRKK